MTDTHDAPAPGSIAPMDEHNRRLLGYVHPSDWTNPTPSGRYNLVVVGAGTAGLVAAAGAAGLGAKVALIERHLMGGDCLNVGCVPSKGLISASRIAAVVRDAAGFGVRTPDGVSVDFPKVMERMRRLRASIAHVDGAARFTELGVDVYLGDGRFTGRDTVEVGGATLRFKKAVIATGARAAAPPIPGLAEAGYLTNETIFSLTSLPRRLVVLGGGPIGCELAQAFARFGSGVTLLEMGAQILGREDPVAARVVQRALEQDGVDVVTEAKTDMVAREGDEHVLALEVGGARRELRADALLVGIGRKPNVDGLGLDQAGVRYDPRLGVEVDDTLRTSNKNVFAAGDICSKYKFTHAADFQARIVIQNALFMGRKKASALVMPWCTYTDPEIAHVGMYEADAAAAGFEVDTYTQPFSEVDRAILDGETVGFAKVHVHKGTDRIVGATIVAPHAGEMISEITLAMVAGKGLSTISAAIHPYPTQADAIRKLGDQYNRTRLTPTVKRWMERWLAWTR